MDWSDTFVQTLKNTAARFETSVRGGALEA